MTETSVVNAVWTGSGTESESGREWVQPNIWTWKEQAFVGGKGNFADIATDRQTDIQHDTLAPGRAVGVDTVTADGIEELPVTGFSHAASLHRLKTWHRACDDFTSEGDYCYCFPVEVRLADDKHEIHHEYNIIIQFTTRAFYFKEIFILWTMCLHKIIIIWKRQRRKGQNDLE